MTNLKDKVVLVTGGGQGLGKQIATVLGEAQMKVVIGDIKEDIFQQTAKELTNQEHDVKAVKLDVSDEKNVQEVIDQIIKDYGKLDVIVNNAGIDYTKSITELTVDEWKRVINVNLTGPFLLTKFAYPIMSKQKKGGHIVNIASTAAKRGWPNASAYHASKWGLLGFSYGMHTEGRQDKIKVSTVVAGGMRTPFILDRFPDTPLDVLQDPRNVAETVKFVLSAPEESVVPEVMVIPVKETSWP